MKRLYLSVAAAALLAGANLVHAQGTSPGSAGAPSGSPAAAPPATGAAPSVGPRSGSEASPGMASGQQSGQVPREGTSQRAQDAPGQKSSTMSSDRPEGRMDKGGTAEDRSNRNADSKSGAERSATTGQAGAAGKLSGDQRSKITTVIKQQRVEPASNVNFSISIGTRVPRDVRFYPLPTEIVTIYPAWRGYEFFRVRDEIVVVDPQTLEIVAVLDA